MTTDCLEIYLNCTYFVQKLSSGAICEQFMYNLCKSTKQFHVMFWVNWQKNYSLLPPPTLTQHFNFSFFFKFFFHVVQHFFYVVFMLCNILFYFFMLFSCCTTFFFFKFFWHNIWIFKLPLMPPLPPPLVLAPLLPPFLPSPLMPPPLPLLQRQWRQHW